MENLFQVQPSQTKLLAKKLGLLPAKRKAVGGAERPQKRRRDQLLTYLIVIDFESTCWKDKKGRPEIIEFPAVLLELSTGKVCSKFHHYVQPSENPILSSFCKELTGISQGQVDAGIPLPTCLYLFNKWVTRLKEEVGVVLMEPGQEYAEREGLAVLATWTDWDLEICLNNECSRKQIKKSNFLNQWIDIRATYRNFYERRPSGLSGALEDLGIKFIGRQHSGIDDATNTARLCHRMAQDGCRLTITKCIRKQLRPVIKPPSPLDRQPLATAPDNIAAPKTSSKSCTPPQKPRNIEDRTRSDSSVANTSNSSKIIKPTITMNNPPRNSCENAEMCKEHAPCEQSDKQSDDLDISGSELFGEFASELDEWEREMETEKMAPHSTSAPHVTFAAPHMTFAAPHMTFIRPHNMTSAGPHTTSTGAHTTSSGLPVTSGITFAGPDTTNARPQTTPVGSRVTSAGPHIMTFAGLT